MFNVIYPDEKCLSEGQGYLWLDLRYLRQI